MKQLSLFILIFICVSCISCAELKPIIYTSPEQVYIGKGYGPGNSAPYGEGIHPGIDYNVRTGTPILAVSDGIVGYVGYPQGQENGITIVIIHGDYFESINGHLSQSFLEKGAIVKRGQLIGLSGASNNYGKRDEQHLHFGIAKSGKSGKNYSDTLDPSKLWLGSKPQCFDPNKDYSKYSDKEITFPIMCSDAKGSK